MSDTISAQDADQWRDETWQIIRECGNLDFLVLTAAQNPPRKKILQIVDSGPVKTGPFSNLDCILRVRHTTRQVGAYGSRRKDRRKKPDAMGVPAKERNHAA